MKIAVYSGSFDPLHIGHLAIMEYLTQKEDFDWVYLVVTPQNPLKEAEKARTGMKRFRAARRAVRRHPGLKVKVDRIELRMEPPHYTIRTLDALREREPDNEFTLVIGADNLERMHKWKAYSRILKEFGVLVYPRQGVDAQALQESLLAEDSEYKIRIIDAPMVDISSTFIREGLQRGENMDKWLM
ncbi:MAG: nicotinate (nicotinamide) nucleotide adenylyltransferase [Bacteroidales bacterium]|nr:nicotinate (nicotinamide) nucleotide adenylyltransferase [Bacteroidales bacterium]